MKKTQHTIFLETMEHHRITPYRKSDLTWNPSKKTQVVFNGKGEIMAIANLGGNVEYWPDLQKAISFALKHSEIKP